MGLLTWLKGTSERCSTCEALQAHITFLEDELRFRRQEVEATRFQLYKALRLEPTAAPPTERPHVEPVNRGRGGKSWPRLQAELEEKFKRQGPEDDREAYWKQKASELEAQAGLSSPEIDQVDPQFLEDMKELAR